MKWRGWGSGSPGGKRAGEIVKIAQHFAIEKTQRSRSQPQLGRNWD